MSELTPLSDNRKEHFLNGEVLEPLQTRREYYYAGRENELPPHQPTREELFIQKYRGGGGDITLKTLDVEANGTYNAPTGVAYNKVNVNVENPPIYVKEVPNLPASIASFSDGAVGNLADLKIAIEPVQDLHGYDDPWAGGAGKNKLQVTATTLTTNGVTFTVNTDGTISTSGTATGDIDFYVGAYTSTGATYSASGCPSGGATDSTYWMFFGYMGADSGSGVSNKTIASGNNITARIYVKNGTNMNGKVFKPMIEVGSTISTFAPYSNICPISGWDEINVTRTGKNLWSLGNITGTKMFEVDVNIPIGSWTFSCEITSADVEGTTSLIIFYYDDDTSFLTRLNRNTRVSYTFTSTKHIKKISFYAGYNSNQSAGDTFAFANIQLEVGETATTYEPYAGTTYTIDLDGTRYGGTLDVVSGVLTVDSVYYQFNSTKSYSITGSARLTNRWITSLTNVDGVSDYIKTRSNVLSSISPQNVEYTSITVSGFCKNLSSPYPIINLNDSDSGLTASSSATDIANAVNTFLHQHTPQIVYELATPITIHLAPTQVTSLLADNNIYADCGQVVRCVYPCTI